MDVSPQQQTVGNAVGFRSPVRAKVGTSNSRSGIKTSDRASSTIGFQQRRPEVGLSLPGNDLPVEATTNIVIVIQGLALGGDLLIHLRACRGLQDINNR